jgi:hypothetical protein
MDIANLKPQTRTIEILHPATKENLGIRVEVLSLEDSKISTQRRKIANQKMQLEQRGKTFKAEDVETNLNELLFATIVSWDWYDADFNGEVLSLTHANVMKVFKELPWFKDQLAEVVGDTESFFQI